MKAVIKIKSSLDLYDALHKWSKRKEENFVVVTLNGGHDIIKIHHVTKGLVNRTIIHPREVFYHAIKDYAVAVAFAHNHPSGLAYPSDEDDIITKRLCMSAKILGFNVLDHMIVTKHNYYSYRASGKIDDSDIGFKMGEIEKHEKFADDIAAEKIIGGVYGEE